MTRIVIPDPLYQAGPKVNEPDPAALRRIVAELSVRLTTMSQQIEILQRRTTLATDITLDPLFVGQTAVVGPDVYVAVGLVAADWTLVS